MLGWNLERFDLDSKPFLLLAQEKSFFLTGVSAFCAECLGAIIAGEVLHRRNLDETS